MTRKQNRNAAICFFIGAIIWVATPLIWMAIIWATVGLFFVSRMEPPHS